MVGLAVASCTIEPFTAMAARKVKGSRQALSLIKSADKVSSVCNDVIGDVCGILSGAAGASIVAKIIMDAQGDFKVILISSLVASIIAGLTIFGKSIFKKVAIKYCNEITLALAKFINFFTRKG
jgi:CBS domain containing-hemolysin-like protein